MNSALQNWLIHHWNLIDVEFYWRIKINLFWNHDILNNLIIIEVEFHFVDVIIIILYYEFPTSGVEIQFLIWNDKCFALNIFYKIYKNKRALNILIELDTGINTTYLAYNHKNNKILLKLNERGRKNFTDIFSLFCAHSRNSCAVYRRTRVNAYIRLPLHPVFTCASSRVWVARCWAFSNNACDFCSLATNAQKPNERNREREKESERRERHDRSFFSHISSDQLKTLDFYLLGWLSLLLLLSRTLNSVC